MSTKYSYIYKATNKENRKSYIGQTINDINYYINYNHINAALNRNSNKCFHGAIRKYGEHCFIWEILFEGECTSDKLNELEIFFIDKYNSLAPNGYNLTIGGDKFDLSKHPNKKEIYKRIAKTRNKNKKQIGKNISISLNKINQETGLSRAQEIGLKTSKTRKKLLRDKTKNPTAKKYLLISANCQMIGAYGNLKQVCKKYNLSYKIIKRFINKGKIPQPKISKKNTHQSLNATGWSIYEIIVNS